MHLARDAGWRRGALGASASRREGCPVQGTIQQPPSTGKLARGVGETLRWTSTRSVRLSSRSVSMAGHRSTAKAYANRLLVNERVIDTRARERSVAAGNRGSQVRGAKR